MVQTEDWERNKVFASANRADGFHSDFEAVFSEVGRRILLKGGPGTGKSSFLRAVAEAAEKRGMAAERFACSSDPSSLDGVIIPALDLALVDATAPHEMSPRLPGAADELLDFGQFWDRKQLAGRRAEIESLCERKASGYRTALLGLAQEGALLGEGLRRLEGLLLRERMAAAVSRLGAFPVKKRAAVGQQRSRTILSPGMRGTVLLRGLEGQAAEIRCVSPFYGSEFLFLEELRCQALAAGQAVTVSYDPLLPRYPNAVYLEESRRLFLVGNSDGGVNLRRFFEAADVAKLRPLLRTIRQCRKPLRAVSEAGFAEMREAHFALEKIYGAAMDFTAKERFQQDYLASLFA